MFGKAVNYLGLPLFVFCCMACASSKASIQLPNGDRIEVGAKAFLRGDAQHDFAVVTEDQMEPNRDPIILAGDPVRYTGTVRGDRAGYLGRIRINVYEQDSSRTVPTYTPYSSRSGNPCFPHKCGQGITDPVTNTAPRTEDDMISCYYDAAGVLFYERPGKDCPYIRRFNENTVRIEKSRQEWLKRQSANPQGLPGREPRRGETQVPERP